MKLAFVEIAGFRGFKDKIRFEFPPGFAVLTGPNGVGKSTALDAIDFALTGTINKYAVKEAKGGGLEDHIWWVGEGTPAEQYVSVGFIDESDEVLEVIRSRERGLHIAPDKIASRLWLGGPHSDDWATTLMQTSLIRDETIAALSLDLPEQARFAAVRAALGGLYGVNHSPRTGAILHAAIEAKETQDRRLAAVEADLGRALTAVTEARSIAERHTDAARAESIIESLTKDIPLTLPNRAEAIRRLIADRKSSVAALNEALYRSERLLNEQRYFESEAAKDELGGARAELDEARESYKRAAAQLALSEQVLGAERTNDAFASHMRALLDHGEAVGLQSGHCPLCATAQTPEEFIAAIAAARTQLKERGDRAARAAEGFEEARIIASKALIKLRQAEEHLTELETRQQRFFLETQEIEKLYANLEVSLSPSDLTGVRDLILKRQEDTARLEQALLVLEASGAHDRVAALRSRVDQLRTMMDEELARVSSAERAVDYARQIDNAAKTIANQVLAEQFDTVMPLLKELYSRLRPHTDWREIEIDFGGRVRASLNFMVGDGKNPQFLFSSGQRRAAGLAFLLSIHLSRPWSGLQSLLLDDPIQHIDDYRALNLVEVLSAIRRTGRQIVIAIQDPTLADVLCRRLRSTPLEPGRLFDLRTKPNGSAGIHRQTDVFALPGSTMEIAEAS